MFAIAKVKKKNLVMKDLEEIIQQKLDRLLFNIPDRIDYYERYQQIITDYNSEQDRATIEKTFMDLMDLSNSLDQEEQRYVREGFESDEELSLYDMLFRDNLSKTDIKKIKEVAASLLKKIKAKIAELDQRSSAGLFLSAAGVGKGEYPASRGFSAAFLTRRAAVLYNGR